MWNKVDPRYLALHLECATVSLLHMPWAWAWARPSGMPLSVPLSTACFASLTLFAQGIPAMDDGNSTDAYIVAYLVPPPEGAKDASTALADDLTSPLPTPASVTPCASAVPTPSVTPCVSATDAESPPRISLGPGAANGASPANLAARVLALS